MRQSINLSSKIIGIILIVTGVMLTLHFAMSVLHYLVAGPFPGASPDPIIRVQDIYDYVMFHGAVQYVLLGLLHTAMGCYLLQDDNKLVRMALGHKQTTDEDRVHPLSEEAVEPDYSDYAPKK